MGKRSESVTFQDVFAGREHELSELRQGLAEALAGKPRLFLISGEPGIGKTRLAEELSADAEARGARVIWGRCWAGGGAPAYWPWIQVVRSCIGDDGSTRIDNLLKTNASQVEDLSPELNQVRHSSAVAPKFHALPSSDPEEARFRLFDSVGRLLKSFAESSPLMIVLDDLQEADQASLLMLRFIARHLKETSVLLVGIYREAEVRSSPPLIRLIGEIAHESKQLSLRGLNDVELASWLKTHSGSEISRDSVNALIRATAGNPLFIDGILRHLAAHGRDLNDGQLSLRDLEIPDGVRETIRQRLSLLSDEGNALLLIAAVIGQEFQFECLRQVSAYKAPIVIEALNEVRQNGLIHPVLAGGLGYRFDHDLIRETIYEGLSAAVRTSLHLSVGRALESTHSSDLTPLLPELARHYRESVVIGDPTKAIDYSIRAGEAALAIFAYEEAANHWRTALQLMEQNGGESQSRANLHRRLGWMLYRAVDRSQGVAHLEAALALYQSGGCRQETAMVHSQLGLAKGRFSSAGAHINIGEAMAHFREAESLVDPNDLPSRARLYQSVTVVASDTCQFEAALSASEKAMQIFERLGNTSLWSSTASHRARALMVRGRHTEATSLLTRMAEIVVTLPNPEIQRDALWSAAYYHLAMRNPSQARRLLESGANRKALSPLQNSMRTEVVLALDYLTGNLTNAEALSLRHPGNPIFRSQVAFRKGDWELAFKQLHDSVERFRRNNEPWNLCGSLRLLIELFVLAEEYHAAVALMPDVLAAHQGNDLYWEMYSRPSMALLALHTGHLDQAQKHVQSCRKILAQGENWLGLAGPVARAEGSIAAADGDIDQAQEHFERAIETATRYALPWDAADTLYSWGRALLNASDQAGAVVKLDAAAGIYRRHGGGQRWIDRIEQHRQRALDSAKRSRVTDRNTSMTTPTSCSFCHEGDYWLISFGETVARLKDAKGFHYLAYLLHHPGVEVPATYVAGLIDNAIDPNEPTNGRCFGSIRSDLGDAGPLLDARAKADYARSIKDFGAELAEAERFNDLGRAERVRSHIEALAAQLRAATGPGGIDRRAASHAERARSTVSKRIRFAIRQIQKSSPTLGDHLSKAIRTGYRCVYQPTESISWQF